MCPPEMRVSFMCPVSVESVCYFIDMMLVGYVSVFFFFTYTGRVWYRKGGGRRW